MEVKLTIWCVIAIKRLQLLTIYYCTQKGFLPLSNHSKYGILLEKQVCMINAQLSRDLENPLYVRIPLGKSRFCGKSATSC